MPTTKPITKKLSPVLTEELRNYFETHNAAKLNRNLRCMFLDYLAAELRIGVPLYLDELLWQLHDLFQLLDLAASETQSWHIESKKTKAK